jgi:hypothetical protein
MQRGLHDQVRLKPAAVVGPFAVEAEGMPALLVHHLHALAHPSEPAPEPRGPRRPAMVLGRAEDVGAIGPPPGLLVNVPW